MDTTGVYRIAKALNVEDLLQVALLSASSTAADPLLNIMLRTTSGVSLNSLDSRQDVAMHMYSKALMDFIGKSFVFMSFDCSSPHIVQASVLIQYFQPDAKWHVSWRDQPGSFDIPPNCINANLYYAIENALHTNRKTYMQGKNHYCAPLKHAIVPERWILMKHRRHKTV